MKLSEIKEEKGIKLLDEFKKFYKAYLKEDSIPINEKSYSNAIFIFLSFRVVSLEIEVEELKNQLSNK